jgi:hypothetical protein
MRGTYNVKLKLNLYEGSDCFLVTTQMIPEQTTVDMEK